ncbi:DUF6881 domain-containing protein [Pseudomonas sp. CGJS7]|uniref:DUF6881 domain-containing protein n=1 Tax=Pseudomonas sp. CGJS7 TaxID=3109348 RepID=UPI00300BF999
MTYLKVQWHHNIAMEPVLLLSELDNERYELRKIEIFADGRLGFASEQSSTMGTTLSESPLPEAEEIAKDAQFTVLPLSASEFETTWEKATERQP